MVNTGDLAILKSSGETVYVLQVGHPDSPMLEAGYVEVRRPVGTQKNGIVHLVERYFDDEIESLRDHYVRECQETKLRYQVAKEYSLVEAAPDVKNLLQ